MIESNRLAVDRWKALGKKYRKLGRLAESFHLDGSQRERKKIETLMEDIKEHQENTIELLKSQQKNEGPWAILTKDDAVMRHMLGNPLIECLGATSNLIVSSKTHTQEFRERARKRSIQAAQANQRLSNSLSKLFSQKVNKQPSDVSKVLENVKRDLEGHLDSWNTTLEVRAEKLKPLLHSDLLYWILREMVGNSFKSVKQKYGEAGGKITIRHFSKGSTSIIKVADNGVGIPHKLLSGDTNIFRGHSGFQEIYGRAGSGTIIPNIKRIIEMHGGTLEVESKPNEGATFTIKLPSKNH